MPAVALQEDERGTIQMCTLYPLNLAEHQRRSHSGIRCLQEATIPIHKHWSTHTRLIWYIFGTLLLLSADTATRTCTLTRGAGYPS